MFSAQGASSNINPTTGSLAKLFKGTTGKSDIFTKADSSEMAKNENYSSSKLVQGRTIPKLQFQQLRDSRYKTGGLNDSQGLIQDNEHYKSSPLNSI